MFRKTILASLLVSSAMTLAIATPVSQANRDGTAFGSTV